MGTKNSSKGKLFVVSGPSGSGKGTLLHKIFEKSDNLKYSVSATTRPRRDGEQDGIDYYFKTPVEFKEMIDENGLLEWAEYCTNFYGTPRAPIEDWLLAGYHVILEIEVMGAMQVLQKKSDAKFVFIAPPSMEVLEARLRSRGTEDEEGVHLRMKKAEDEMRFMPKYDKVILNGDADVAAEELLRYINEA